MRRALPLAILPFIALLLVVLPGKAHAVGMLVPTAPEIAPLMIRSHRVTVTIRERAAETRVEQVFHNHTSQRLEATYVFPVPVGATVSGFSMWVNGNRVDGELLDAAQARGVYEGIVARLRDPGLVEYMGGNLFRARVFPIEANADQRIEIRFTQALDYAQGVIHYQYPLHTSGAAARTLEDLTIRADIVSRTPIGAVYSPSHALAVSRPDALHATASFEANAVTLDQDFDLYYSVQDHDVGLSLLTHRDAGDDGYFLAMISPRSDVTEHEIAAKEVLFVVDTSGSMSGEKLDRAKAALDAMVQRLRPTDRFQIVRFSTDVETLFDGGQTAVATPDNVARARRFAQGFYAAGGTAIDPALGVALGTPRAPGMPRMVVFLTDGMPTVGETEPERILAHVTQLAGDARVFAFGVGDDVNTTFLDALAAQCKGAGDYFRDGHEMEQRLSAFWDRIAFPVVTDLALAIPGINVYDVYPRDLGHLYRGQQLLVMGRYRGDGASHVALSGKVSGETDPRSFGFDVSFAPTEPDNGWLPALWATRKIGYLLDEIRLHGERAELRDEVVTLSRRFGIVTPYTSYLVAPDEQIQVALPLNPPPVVLGNNGGMMQGQRQQTQHAAERPATQYTFDAEDFASASVAGASAPAMAGSGGGGYGRGSGAVQNSPHRVAMDPPAPPPVVTSTPTYAPSGGMGDTGRRVSAGLRAMEEADQTDTATRATESRYVGGRAFTRQSSGAWTDERFHGQRTLRIRYASRAYFALLAARPALGAILSLGDQVTVALDDVHAVVIASDASNDVTAAQVSSFLAN